MRAGARLIACISLFGAMLVGSPAAQAGVTCAVPTTAYPTIQSAIDDGCTVINVRAGSYSENLTVSSGSITIDGVGIGKTKLLAKGTGAAITVLGGTVLMRELTLTDTDADSSDSPVINYAALALDRVKITGMTTSGSTGGALLNFGSLDISQSAVSNNTVAGASGSGGAIFNSGGSITMNSATFSGNTTDYRASGIHNQSAGVISISDSTFSGNAAGGDQGGVILNVAGSTVSITNSTFANNTAGTGATAILNFGGAGEVSLFNSILADTDGDSPLCDGSVSTGGNNIASDTTCFATSGSDLAGTDPLVLPLANNGGGVLTHALDPSSPAIDHGPVGCGGFDGRGVPRPTGSVPCDTGGYERAFCGGVLVNIVGTSGKDALTGTGSADGIMGLAGADVIDGAGGNDDICTGAGLDRAYGGEGGDKLYGDAGNDRLFGDAGSDELFGQEGDDRLNGGTGNDVCLGGPGSDTLVSC